MDDKLNDSKIELKNFKEKKTTRTYIYNLDKFITDEKKLEDVITTLKKKILATSCIEKNTETGKIYGFQGIHEVKIRKYLIDNNLAQETDFKFS
jgi:translation initiation factor 1 (eIF-1/SUI1)